MFDQATEAFRARVLIVDDELGQRTAIGRAATALAHVLRELGAEVIEARSADDGLAVVGSDAALHAILVDWRLSDADVASSGALSILRAVRGRDLKVPIFLTTERTEVSGIPLEAMQLADEFVWMLEDTADFLAGRVLAAARRYRAQVLPPMAAALFRFAATHEYSWHTPGHTGGTAFLKAPAGRAFVDHFGEALLRSDLSISIGELGSLLDHTGAIGAGERYAARVFGAHRTYTVTNGSSTSNRVIFTASLTAGDLALCDRNCHKSIEHGLILTGAIPVYLRPTRNHLGLIGPIPQARLGPAAIAAAVADTPLARAAAEPRPVHAVITNSTYDGLCYDAARVTAILDASVDRVHFDEAWFAYARFNPLYRDRYAMRGDPATHTGPTVFATHSTHKLLAALSQAAFLHVRDGRRAIDHARFNEAFMMHASTSPLYPLIATNDISAAMMDGPGGAAITTDAIREAVHFRQSLRRLAREFEADGEWFLDVWNPTSVTLPATGETVAFEQAPADVLVAEPSAWTLRPGDAWHGFPDLTDGECLLDPIKVSVVTPGLGLDGSLQPFGVPAALLTAYLGARGIEVEKTTDFTVLFLFSIGVTKGKWGTLVHAFLDFKADLDANVPVDRAIPDLAAAAPARYAGVGLKDLAADMMATLAGTRQTHWLSEAFSILPEAPMTPAAAYRHLVRGAIDVVSLDEAADRVVATGVVPYPPGIPLLMAGERTGSSRGPCLSYLRALETWDARFPGLGHDTHGVEVRDGRYCVRVVRAQES